MVTGFRKRTSSLADAVSREIWISQRTASLVWTVTVYLCIMFHLGFYFSDFTLFFQTWIVLVPMQTYRRCRCRRSMSLALKLPARLRCGLGSTPMRGGCKFLTDGCWFTPKKDNKFIQLWKLTAVYNRIRLNQCSQVLSSLYCGKNESTTFKTAILHLHA